MKISEARLQSFCSSFCVPFVIIFDYYGLPPVIPFYLIYGFGIRVLCGPRFDVQSWFVHLILHPLLVERWGLLTGSWQPGPPKRMAQSIGLTFCITATLARYVFWPDQPLISYWIWATLLIVATLLWSFDICLGCSLFYLLMRTGIIPETVCVKCRIKYVHAEDWEY